MKIAITSTGEALESQVEPRFSKAKILVTYDVITGETHFVKNYYDVDYANIAGLQTARNIVQLEADFLITGGIGSKAFKILQEAGINVIIGAKGKIFEIIEQFISGLLYPIKISNMVDQQILK